MTFTFTFQTPNFDVILLPRFISYLISDSLGESVTLTIIIVVNATICQKCPEFYIYIFTTLIHA